MLSVLGVGRSDVGRVRSNNEDSFVVDEALGLFAVSDGMGGHAGGEVASSTAISVVTESVQQEHELLAAVTAGTEHRNTLAQIAERAVAAAAARVHALATSPEGPSGMGCTLTVLLVAGRYAAMAHVGDSRLYLIRGDQTMQLSTDHTVVGEMVKTGMAEEGALEDSPFAHMLTRAVGTQAAVQAETLVVEAIPGDKFLLCSDGFTNHLDDTASLGRALVDLRQRDALEKAVAEFIDAANEAGGRDNITVVVAGIDSEAPQPERAEAVAARSGALRSVFMFEDLEPAMIERVLAVCRVESHDEGAVLVECGELSGELLVVVTGRYELVADDGGVGHLGPGDFVGATTLIKPRASKARIRAIEPSRMLRLSGTAFSRLIRRRPWLGIGLLERLGRKLSQDLDRSYEQREGSEDTVRIRERF